MKLKKTSVNPLIVTGIVIIILIGSAYLINDITKKADSQLGEVQLCIESCQEMISQLPKLNPESESYERQINRINNKTIECIELNNLEENSLDESEILEGCDYVLKESKIQKGQCVDSGKTIYLEKDESCQDGIERCCSGRGLCGKDQSSVPDHVSCLP